MVDGKDVGGEEGGFDSENENKENVSPVAYSQPPRVAGETEGRAVLASIAHLEAGDDAEFVELELENDDESLHEQKIDEGYKAPDTVIKVLILDFVHFTFALLFPLLTLPPHPSFSGNFR